MGGTRTGGRRTYWGLYGSTKRTEAAGIVRVGTLKDYGMAIVGCRSEVTLPMGAVVFRNRRGGGCSCSARVTQLRMEDASNANATLPTH